MSSSLLSKLIDISAHASMPSRTATQQADMHPAAGFQVQVPTVPSAPGHQECPPLSELRIECMLHGQ